MIPSGDRQTAHKDNYATFLMTNMIPQNPENNQDIGQERWWLGIETFSRQLVSNGRELYIIAGGRGSRSDILSQNGFLINVPERLWKVVLVLDRPGQGISDVTPDTIAFAIDIPNIDPEDDTSVNPNNWHDYVISVQELENRLQADLFNNYDFLSNIPIELQERIENRSRDELIAWINNPPPLPVAPLMATDSITISSDINKNLNASSTITSDSSIRHNSFVEDSIFTKNNKKLMSSTQIGMTKVDSFERCLVKKSITQISMTEVSITENTFPKNRTTKIDSFQIRTFPTTFVNTSFPYIGIPEVNFPEPNTFKVSIAEISFSENNSREILFPQANSRKINPGKISFPSVIPSEQFFSIHDSTSQTINQLNNNVNTLWSNIIPSDQIDITYEITDLPTGQLAEAQITGFDTEGTPNQGTILIDYNGNGVGWFIDETPLDNSEFNTTLTETAYQATSNSPAYGKYDLLTTILHETGHLYGIMHGYTEFDSHIDSDNHTFTGDRFTAQITPDGSHLDSTTHPYALMNTTLNTGVRKLPSNIDILILQELLNNRNNPSTTYIIDDLDAPLISEALIAGIVNGSFDISDTKNNNYGWNNRGASKVTNGQALCVNFIWLNN